MNNTIGVIGTVNHEEHTLFHAVETVRENQSDAVKPEDIVNDELIPKLKPCPCCGGVACFEFGTSVRETSQRVQVICPRDYCGIRTPAFYFDVEDAYIVKRDILRELVILWNRRKHDAE